MESIECSRDNLEATKYYKKGKSSKMDLYKLYILFTDQVTRNVIDGNIGVSEAKLEMTMFQSQIVSQLKNRVSQETAERQAGKETFDKYIKLGQEMMKPSFDWTTGTSSSTKKSNVWTQGPGLRWYDRNNMTEFDYFIRAIIGLYFLFYSFYVYAKIYKKKIEPFFEKIDNTIIFSNKRL